MTTIVKQRVFAAMQSPETSTPELSAIWRCPMTHTPIATLRLEVTWAHSLKRQGGRNLRMRRTIAFFTLIVVVLLAAAATLAATTYFSGLLVQKIQRLQRYNQPQAQYSDVWNWQRRR